MRRRRRKGPGGERPRCRPAERSDSRKAPSRKGNLMSPSRPFILRPVATALLMVAILLVGRRGLQAAAGLGAAAGGLSDDPGVTFYPGASPDVMASSVTAPLERQFGQVPGLNQMTSTSSEGCSVITLQFVARSEHRRGRAGGAGGDQRGRHVPAARTCRTRRSTARPIRPTRRS